MCLPQISRIINKAASKVRSRTDRGRQLQPQPAAVVEKSAPVVVMGATLSTQGAVRIAVPSSNGVLRPADGEWYFGDIDAKAVDDGDRRFHQWMVARPPGAAADVVVLLNLQTGAFAGVWNDEWGTGNHRVKCSPGHLQGVNIQFRTESANDPNDAALVRFIWLGDESKVLMRKPGKDSVAVRQVGDDDVNSKNFRCEAIQYDYETFPAWMGRLPDDLPLHHVSLPSTHQTLALHGIRRVRPDLGWARDNDDLPRPWGPLPVFIDNPRCQDVSLWEQLQMGVRSLDIRLDLNKLPMLRRNDDGSSSEEGKYFLYARHGLAEMGHSWSAVLLILQTFLQNNPSETVIVNARYEKATPGSRDRWNDWLAAFVDETRPFWDDHPDQPATVYRWWQNGSKAMNDLQLHEVRGKVILTTDGDYMPADEAEGRTRGMRFFPRDMVAVGKYDSKRDEWPQQLSSCEANLNASKNEQDQNRYYQTSLNVSGLPDPLGLAIHLQGIFTKNPLNIVQNVTESKEIKQNEVFDPIDFFQYFRTEWQNRGDDCPLSERSLGKNGEHLVGKIDVDFVDQMRDWAANIVRSNRTVAGKEF